MKVPDSDPTITTLDVGEVAAASRLLARAFAHDPIITYYLHDPARRSVAFPAFFEGVLEEMLPSTQVFAARAGDALVGVAAWLPTDPAQPDQAAVTRARRAHQIVERLFPLTAPALFDGFAALERLHPEDSHWYLAFVGIEPVRQGRGLGRQLLLPVLNVADETRTACYLETPFPRTHAFYEALGFARHGEHRTFAGAPGGVVTFLRRPQY